MQIVDDTFNNLSSPLTPLDLLLDIETTGLSKTNDCIICIGVVYRKTAAEIGCIRWFATSKEDEILILKSLLAFCSSYRTIYTYNGNSFDIPFIISRLAAHGLTDTVFKKLSFIDMKKITAKVGAKRSTIEKILGYQRQTTLTGKELVALYKVFESTKLITYQTLILNHQQDELNSLLALYEAYFIMQHLPNFQFLTSHNTDDYIEVHLQTEFSLSTDCLLAVEDIILEWHKNTTVILLKIALHKGAYKKYLVPAKDYFFIKEQNQLLHKSIAKFLPNELKQKVTTKQCFVVKDGTFIRLYTKFKVREELFYNEREEMFIEYKDDRDILSLVLHQTLHVLLK